LNDIKHAFQLAYEILSPKGRKLFIGVSFFSIFSAFIEALSISLLAPFIVIVSDFEFIQTNNFLSKAFEISGVGSESKFVVMLGLIIVFIYVLRAVISLINTYLVTKYSNQRCYLLASKLFSNYLYNSLYNYTKRNVSDMIRVVASESNQINQLFSGFLTIASELFVLLFLYAIIVYSDYKIALTVTIILSGSAFFVMKLVSLKIKKKGIERVHATQRQFRSISSSFGNFRILKLCSLENNSISEFKYSAYDASLCSTHISVLHNVPRLGLETVGFIVMVVGLSGYVWINDSSAQSLMPIFILFSLALYRILPSLNRILSSYNQILASSESLRVIHREINCSTEALGNKDIEFKDTLVLNKIKYSYDSRSYVLSYISLKVEKGEHIAFVGESGHGKSTLIDIITGLLRPDEGNIFVDDVELNDKNMRSWRNKIGYIPQSVYLFDGSVADNVVFHRDYDETRLIEVLRKSNILDYLNTKMGINTLVGDAGVLLSGGQRQRISIARALYGNPEILVLDEATSALDVETEKLILKEIESLNITVITVTHRTEALSDKQTVYKVENGLLELIRLRKDI